MKRGIVIFDMDPVEIDVADFTKKLYETGFMSEVVTACAFGGSLECHDPFEGEKLVAPTYLFNDLLKKGMLVLTEGQRAQIKAANLNNPVIFYENDHPVKYNYYGMDTTIIIEEATKNLAI